VFAVYWQDSHEEILMATDSNKHGLSRRIPASIKREVRKRCGFGCVVCGMAIAQYEHFDPEFADAKEHDALGITLLCGGCHDKVTRKFWSKEKVRMHNAKPLCIERGHAHDAFDISTDHPVIRIGPTAWIDTWNVLEVMGEQVLAIKPPEESGGPYLLSGILSDDSASELLIIEDNEWKVPSAQWDCVAEGRTVTIRRKLGEILLSLEVMPGIGIDIKRLNLAFNGARLYGSGNNFTAKAPDGSSISMNQYSGIGCRNAISIERTSVQLGQSAGILPCFTGTVSYEYALELAPKIRRLRELVKEQMVSGVESAELECLMDELMQIGSQSLWLQGP
jgi:hypothetical protein